MTRLLTPLMIALVAVQAAQAGPLWGYRSPSNTNVLTPGSDAGLTFPNTSWTDSDGDGSIVVTPVQQWSVALATDPDRVEAGEYTIGLEVIDYASGMSGMVDFAGKLDGTIWKEGATLTNTFTGATSKSLDLGDYRYTVALDGFESPNGFGEDGQGTISADVTITALGDDPPPPVPTTPPVDEDPDPPAAQTPEPATAVMGAIGLGAVAFARLRRRRVAIG